VFLAVGAAVLMVSTSFAPGFGRDSSVPLALEWLLLINAGLVLIIKAMTDLAIAAASEQEPAAAG
jgi:hypothetical protein